MHIFIPGVYIYTYVDLCNRAGSGPTGGIVLHSCLQDIDAFLRYIFVFLRKPDYQKMRIDPRTFFAFRQQIIFPGKIQVKSCFSGGFLSLQLSFITYQFHWDSLRTTSPRHLCGRPRPTLVGVAHRGSTPPPGLANGPRPHGGGGGLCGREAPRVRARPPPPPKAPLPAAQVQL